MNKSMHVHVEGVDGLPTHVTVAAGAGGVGTAGGARLGHSKVLPDTRIYSVREPRGFTHAAHTAIAAHSRTKPADAFALETTRIHRLQALLELAQCPAYGQSCHLRHTHHSESAKRTSTGA